METTDAEQPDLGSTIVFAPMTIDQALDRVGRNAGYRNCEIGAVKGWFEHIDPDTISDAELSRIRNNWTIWD